MGADSSRGSIAMFLVDTPSGALAHAAPRPPAAAPGWRTVRGADWGETDVRPLHPGCRLERLDSQPLGELRCNHFAMAGLELRRTPDHLRREAPSYVLALPLAGASRNRIDRQDVTVAPGRLYLLNGTVAAQIRPQGLYETLNLQIPTHLLQQRVPRLPAAFVAALDGSDARADLLAHGVRHAHALAARLDPDAAALAATQLCDLVALLLRGDARACQDDRSLAAGHRRRVLAFLDRHGADEDLDAGRIAQGCGISERYLHKLFHASGQGVMERLRRLRLQRAYAMLATPALASLPVSEVAYRCGFRSLSSFSRAFRQQHGLAPSALRGAGGAADVAPPAVGVQAS
jgi:AraC-like DNA-binding protein